MTDTGDVRSSVDATPKRASDVDESAEARASALAANPEARQGDPVTDYASPVDQNRAAGAGRSNVGSGLSDDGIPSEETPGVSSERNQPGLERESDPIGED